MTPKPFAKLYLHPGLGQILVLRDTNDEDMPGLRIRFDAGIENLKPSDVFLSVGGVDEDAANDAADALFATFDETMAVAAVLKQIPVIKRALGHTL